MQEGETMPSPEKESDVYFVESQQDGTVLVAMDVNVNEQNRMVSWFDTVKERMMGYENIQRDNTSLSFTRLASEGGGDYNFQPMTLEIYQEKVKPKLLAPQDFDNLDSLKQAFEETKSSAW